MNNFFSTAAIALISALAIPFVGGQCQDLRSCS